MEYCQVIHDNGKSVLNFVKAFRDFMLELAELPVLLVEAFIKLFYVAVHFSH